MRSVLIIFSFVLFGLAGLAQVRFAINDSTGDFPIKQILNTNEPFSSFKQANDRLVILDFFGTWCAPCVRALPNLKLMQEKFGQDIRILLVAEESVSLLKNFISRQNGFNLAMVIDSGGLIRQYFQPPYYPFTLVIGKKGRVLALPSQGQITEQAIREWIAAQENINPPAAATSPSTIAGEIKKTETAMHDSMTRTTNQLVQLSQDFLYAAKTGDSTSSFISQLKNISMDELEKHIHTDDEKKAFWINLYNAYTQVLLKANPEQYAKRGKFFGSRSIIVAGHAFSLDDIEHGLLRRSKIKWSLGYLNKFFPGKTEKRLRVNKLDYRLHFALNCGAKSCPPIAFYKPEEIDRQLDLATKAYLSGEAEYDAATNRLKLPAIMGWFRRDFGGKQKMITLVKRYGLVPDERSPRIKFKKYNWSLFLQNYK